MNAILLYLSTGLMMVCGLAIIGKEAGWPSDRERKNRVIRSFRTALGATVFITGLILVVSYRSPSDSLIGDFSVV